nr:hypothetical protein [Sphingomonas paeninsulae]
MALQQRNRCRRCGAGGDGYLPAARVLSFAYIDSGELNPVLDDFQPDEEPIWAVYPQRRHLLPKISRLVEALRDELPAAMGNSRDS